MAATNERAASLSRHRRWRAATVLVVSALVSALLLVVIALLLRAPDSNAAKAAVGGFQAGSFGFGSKPIPEVVDRMFDEADADRNGTIDIGDEATKKTETLGSADGDEDGRVSRSELMAFLKRYDADRDGRLGRREVQSLRRE